MKKIFILALLTLSLSSCNDVREFPECKGGIVVDKVQSAWDDLQNSKMLVLRLKGKLVYTKVTNYEASGFQLGDTIK